MKKLYLILIPLLVIFIGVLSFLLIECRQTVLDLSGQEIPKETAGYPDNLLEGRVVSLNLEEPVTLIIDADISKIVPGTGNIKKNIKVDSNTELVLHSTTPEEDSPMQLDELQPDDFVLVGVRDSIRNNALTQETFTALKIIKIIGE